MKLTFYLTDHTDIGNIKIGEAIGDVEYLSLNKLIRVRFSRDVYSRFSRILHISPNRSLSNQKFSHA